MEKSSKLYFFTPDPSNPQAAQLKFTQEQVNLSDNFFGFGIYQTSNTFYSGSEELTFSSTWDQTTIG